MFEENYQKYRQQITPIFHQKMKDVVLKLGSLEKSRFESCGLLVKITRYFSKIINKN